MVKRYGFFNVFNLPRRNMLLFGVEHGVSNYETLWLKGEVLKKLKRLR